MHGQGTLIDQGSSGSRCRDQQVNDGLRNQSFQTVETAVGGLQGFEWAKEYEKEGLTDMTT